jgi:carbonic anhydrase
MQRILNGVRRFQRDVFPKERTLFRRLASGQNPEALFLTCADSRIVPGLITQTGPGDLFICRNAGNIAPPYGEAAGGVSATIEYAVVGLRVKDIVVCGHSHCGAMMAILRPELLHSMPSVAAWLSHADRARLIVEEHHADLSDEEKIGMLTQQNVLGQIDHLRTYPSVASRMLNGELRLHGWVYHIETGVVNAYDSSTASFSPITNAESPLDGIASGESHD